MFFPGTPAAIILPFYGIIFHNIIFYNTVFYGILL